MKPDLAPEVSRSKAAWMVGDYSVFARHAESGALEIFSRWQVSPGSRMLDVACGPGQIAIAAARAGVTAVGNDIATNLIEQARTRAADEALVIQFDEGDAERLPYADASFDTVISMLGAMYAPHPDRVSGELIRVCRSGGRIIMVNWTPEGCMGQMIKLHEKYSPPRRAPSFTLWGDEATVWERLRHGIKEIRMKRGIYPSLSYACTVAEVVERWCRNLGPTKLLFATLDDEKQAAFSHELQQLFQRYNRAADGATLLEAEYLEVTAVRS